MQNYNHYDYDILPIEVEIATGKHCEHPETITGYQFVIYDVWMGGGNEESGEWYETESQADFAAQEKIDELCEGSEPDYDVEPYGQINWEERRRLGE